MAGLFLSKLKVAVCSISPSRILETPLSKVCGRWTQIPNTWSCQQTSVRPLHADWRMVRDVKRRNLVKENYAGRIRVNSLRRNTIIPKVIQEMADKEIAAFPKDSCRSRVVNRCALTSRSRGVLRRWRLSRIMWRHYADYNQLSGVTRSSW